jgi:multiple sugar transport system substrate-binding protein
MWSRILVVGTVLVLPPLAVNAADLVVWWQKGFYPQEDQAVREIITAFEQKTGKKVELSLYEEEKLPDALMATFETGEPPDLAFGLRMPDYIAQWAFEDRLVDLTDTIGSLSNLFDPDALAWLTLLDEKTGQRALYGLPIGRVTELVHVWKSLLEQAGFTVENIPKDWDGFWSFWCDQAQSAVRRATGRDDIWGVGLNMSAEAAETQVQFFLFLAAYDANYVTRDGRLIIDDPEVRRRLMTAIDSYTGIYRKGCTPPDSTSWDSYANNAGFLAHTLLMTPNLSLSIPNALKSDRPDDYYKNTATLEWPLGPHGEAFPIMGMFYPAMVFKDGRNVSAAKDFVRFLVAEGWLAHYLDFAGERFMPPMPKLLDAPFWLDPSDRHRMAAVMQVASRPLQYDYAQASGNWRHDRVWQELTWAKAIHRVAAEGISPEQAVDEAIARIKQILAE